MHRADRASPAAARLSAADARRDQERLAAAYRARGVSAGERIAFVCSNTPLLLSGVLAAQRLGITPVMVNGELTGPERAAILTDCRPALVADVTALAALAGDAPAAALEHGGGALAPVPLARPMHYTSGTTGRPKGVHCGLLSEAHGTALLAEEMRQWGFTADDVHLVCSPLHHSAPLRFSTNTLLAGGDVVVLDRFRPDDAARVIHAHGVSTAFMAPAHLQRLLFERDPALPLRTERFRLLAHAGAPCPPAVKAAALAAFPLGSVWEFYGSTEGQFTVCSTADHLARSGSVGRARPGRTLRADADGVLWCRVPSYARFEYFDDPEKTAAAWRDDEFTVFDLGRVDADGFVYLDGRRDDLIISGGVNVYPLEVELALREVPGVHDVAVFGRDDERWGTRVCAAVVRADADLDEGALRAAAVQVLAPYKRPKEWWFVDAIPHSPTGKVRRGRLAADLGLDPG